MPRIVNLWLLALIFFHGTGCKTGKYEASNLPPEQICFGEGRGVTGAMHEYVLLPNGQLFYRGAVGAELEEIKGISRAKAKKLFAELSEIAFPEIVMDEPGNIYHFVEFYNQDSRHRVTWGRHDRPVDPGLQGLYQKLKDIVPE